MHIPHVFPAASRINPPSPQAIPHEFLTFQFPISSIPTRSPQWLTIARQLLKTPDLYRAQLDASAIIEIGLIFISFKRPLQPLGLSNDLILKLPPFIMHLWLRAT